MRPASEEDPGLSVQSEHGSISQEAAEEAIQRRFKDLTRCYLEAGDARAFAAGPVLLHFALDVTGHVTRAHVQESRLGNFAVERCLVTVASGIAFPRPSGGEATVEYSLEFRSSEEEVVVDLPEGELDGHLREWLPQLAADCHQLGVDQVNATLYIEPAGGVRSVGFASSAPLDLEVGACVAKSLQRWRVPVSIKTGLGRATIALRNSDLLNPPEPPRVDRRRAQGRRPGGRRR